ncbi:YafY family protein [Flectobacillus sp. DC10W]|jgi:predicted DNA-binding transcriptional regulator YafY|uniref:YafY family protein n=1 Tax=Flectobacillus longus TaxID=2984207 RepID=A0ABT6YIJ3_9BACT|nr:YafY family protein [Flectobacillus longus]MDI9863229.1 YafY family protein [Flectobacillus longus]
MNRIDRVTAILIQLQSKKVVKAQELADRFEISLRTVYRDIRTLEEAGVPIIGEAGIGYSLMEGYRLPPVMFTKEEATAFLTAEKLVEKLTDEQTRNTYQSALFKVKAVLKMTEKDYLDTISNHIEVLDNPYLPKHHDESNHIQTLLQSIAERRCVEMLYFANHSQVDSQRIIEPVGIFLQATAWYLIAYCRLRSDYRHFRIDRIKELKNTNLGFSSEHPSLQTYLPKFSQRENLTLVKILVQKNVLRYFGDQKYYNGFVDQKDRGEKVEMTFLTASIRGFAHWFLNFGEYAEILEPIELRGMVKGIVLKILEKL